MSEVYFHTLSHARTEFVAAFAQPPSTTRACVSFGRTFVNRVGVGRMSCRGPPPPPTYHTMLRNIALAVRQHNMLLSSRLCSIARAL